MSLRFRMLVADVDGTVLPRSGHVSHRVRAAISAAHDAGVLVTLATGRWFRSARPVATELGISLPIILHNGALVKDSSSGAVLDHCHLPRTLAREAIDIILRHGLQPIVYENAFAGETVLTGPEAMDSAASSRYLAGKLDHVRRVPYERFALEADPLQLAIADSAERADPLILALATDRWRTVTSMTIAAPDARFVEVLNVACSKTRAIEHLCRRYGIGMDQVVAIGDNFNDLDMIEAAGFGIAMGNAPPEVRARAKWVAPSVDDDGLAIAIERVVLTGATGPKSRAAAAGLSE